MSLGPDWWDAREALQAKAIARGEQDLGAFLAQHGLSSDDLAAAGLIRHSAGPLHTAEILSYRLTRKGAALLREEKGCQLILVRKGKVEALLRCLGR